MKRQLKIGSTRRQAGTALLIAIFALLLISVVGIAMLVSTGVDTALAGNYRTSTGA
jgi:Tfp pilus assembly protein PilX